MHENNKKWLDDLKKQYPDSFKNCKVLEVGSKDWNGTVRPWFKDCDYWGIDTENGNGVNQVIHAKDFDTAVAVDTVISFSVLEHDNEWKLSLEKTTDSLKNGGVLFMCWGAEGNIKHNGPWALVPHKEVLDYLSKLEFEILDNFFEEDRYGKNCAGCYNLVAKKQ